MNTVHKPVLLEEVIKYLDPKPNVDFVDGTLGGGGHTEAILQMTSPNGRVLAFDWDGSAIERSQKRLSDFGNRVIYINNSYTKIKDTLVQYEKDFKKIGGVLLDLGLSSDQLQNSGRGFSFQTNEPLDMRFDVLNNPLKAYDIVNGWTVDEITDILKEYGEEKFARKIAQAIVKERSNKLIETSQELAGLIYKIYPMMPRQRIHPATRTFQALRMAVNHEVENIKNFLQNIHEVMPVGCRLAIISFHSIEDRLVKDYFRQESTDCLCPPEIPVCRCNHQAKFKLLTKKPIVPTEAEIQENFRCRSAKMRVVERI